MIDHDRLFRIVSNYARKNRLTREDTEDLVQEVWVKCLERRDFFYIRRRIVDVVREKFGRFGIKRVQLTTLAPLAVLPTCETTVLFKQHLKTLNEDDLWLVVAWLYGINLKEIGETLNIGESRTSQRLKLICQKLANDNATGIT